MKHEWDAITITPVEVVEPKQTEGIQNLKPLGEPETQVGCRVCGMGYNEAHDLPCPGRNFAEMVEELTEDIQGY